MLVEIWSDVVCPWCYIGKRQFETALASFPHRDEVTVEWRSFELDPNAPTRRQLSTKELLAKKYSMTEDQAQAATDRVTGVATEVGLDFRWGDAKSGNTFDAHRLIHLAATQGLGGAAKEALMAAYFTHGVPIGERAALEQVAKEIGLDTDEVAAALNNGAFADEVRADEQLAGELGIERGALLRDRSGDRGPRCPNSRCVAVSSRTGVVEVAPAVHRERHRRWQRYQRLRRGMRRREFRDLNRAPGREREASTVRSRPPGSSMGGRPLRLLALLMGFRGGP